MAFSTCTQLDQIFQPEYVYSHSTTQHLVGTSAHRWRLPLAGEPAPSGEPPAARVGLSFPSLSLRLPGKPGAVPSSHVSRLVFAISISICRRRRQNVGTRPCKGVCPCKGRVCCLLSRTPCAGKPLPVHRLPSAVRMRTISFNPALRHRCVVRKCCCAQVFTRSDDCVRQEGGISQATFRGSDAE